MIGKKIKLNDYKFTYGKETVYVNVYAVFKDKKSGNRYIIYSYDNSKLYYGSAFIKDKEIIVMISKADGKKIIEDFTLNFVNEKNSDEYEIISLGDIDTIEIIDEALCDFKVDMNELYDKTMPKPAIVKEEEKSKKKISVTAICIIVLLIIVCAFFFLNPEVITGKNKKYVCYKSYIHDKLPASVNEEISFTFNSKNSIIAMDVRSDYIFSDTNYYKEFRDKSYFYQYFKDGDTYKFNDSTYTYSLFSKIDTEVDFFLPKKLDELISHYEEDNYTCKVMDIE